MTCTFLKTASANCGFSVEAVCPKATERAGKQMSTMTRPVISALTVFIILLGLVPAHSHDLFRSTVTCRSRLSLGLRGNGPQLEDWYVRGWISRIQFPAGKAGKLI